MNSTALRAGDFLQTAAVSPGENFQTEASVPQLPDEFAVQAIRPAKDLEPMAAAVVEPEVVSDTDSKPSGTRGLEWYLKHKVGTGASANSAVAAAMAPSQTANASQKPDLLGYDQPHSDSDPAAAENSKSENLSLQRAPRLESSAGEQRKEAELFAYIQGEKPSSSRPKASSRFQLPKRALVPALLLAGIAVVAAPQAPWHSWLQGSWRRAAYAVHIWLNPQPAMPKQAPVAHETFTRAGDEYKLPVAEQIPDATTDPSQIQVVPVTDPTIKKTNPQGGNAMDPSAVPVDGSALGAETPAEDPSPQISSPQPRVANPDPFRPPGQPPAQSTVSVIETPVGSGISSATPSVIKPAPPQPAQPRVVTPLGTIPPSLKSQLAPATPAPVANKMPDAVAPAIEPVEVSENAERALITDSPAPIYPSNAKGQQGTVVLQVLIARDGTVQDAKFVQGSLLFARNAIDAVRQWKFKPYLLNGRPVSVQTQLSLRFKPAQ
jgi:protein TonB